MNEIQCKVIVDGVRCASVLRTPEPVSSEASYICKNHPDSIQRAAVGNATSRRPDVHFQEVQYDSDLVRAGIPQGTLHIPRQGEGTPAHRPSLHEKR